MTPVIGIDLGTTFSVVAHVDRGRPTVIPNLYGKPTTPSMVDIATDPPLVGEPALERFAAGATTVTSVFKRYMLDDHYEVRAGDRRYGAVDLSALVLADLKAAAEQALGQPVREAVISVPAYFEEVGRRNTMDAGKQAGLDVLAIINEPFAAALAYGLRPQAATPQRILVYDLGGGTFDVTIMDLSSEELVERATTGHHILGGKDWDAALRTHLQQCFEEEFGIWLSQEDQTALQLYAETLKKQLSTLERVSARVQAAGHTGVYELTRADFDEMTLPLLLDTQRVAEQALEEAGLTWQQLDHVLLVGGSTRLPMVRTLLTQLTGKPPLTNINPDEAVALGAAIYAGRKAAERHGLPTYSLPGPKRMVNVMSHSLGMIAVNDEETTYFNSIILPKNQPIPSQQMRAYTLRNNQLDVFMTQGESSDPGACAYLGKYVLTAAGANPRQDVVFEVAYAYDENGRVQVSALAQPGSLPVTVAVEELPADVPARFLLPPEKIQQRRSTLVAMLAFDVSGSMSGHPLAEAKRAAHALVKEFDSGQTALGISIFSDGAQQKLAPSHDFGQVRRVIDGLVECETGGGTSGQPFNEILAALAGNGITRFLEGFLSGGDTRRVGIVLTDGQWGNQEHAVQLAKKCHAQGIDIIAIGFGSADEQFLRRISSSDQHSFFINLGSLVETFTTIGKELSAGSLAGGIRRGA